MNFLVFIVSIASIVGIYFLMAWVTSRQNKNKCGGLKCWNDSVPNTDCTSCICKNKWRSSDCNICDSFCRNGGVMTPECDICSCKGGWTGDRCDSCGLGPCGTNQTANNECTGCVCKGGWKGQDCSSCAITCAPGQIVNEDCTNCIPK